MGVEPFLTGSAVSAVLAQRLARRLCTNCCEMYVPTMEELVAARVSPDMAAQREGMALYRKVGCPRCNRTGYKGRIGIFQLLVMDDELEALAAQNAPRDEIERVGDREGHALAVGRRAREGRRRPHLDGRARPRRHDVGSRREPPAPRAGASVSACRSAASGARVQTIRLARGLECARGQVHARPRSLRDAKSSPGDAC